MHSQLNVKITGHVKITDLSSQEVLVDRYNAINSETMSIILANMLQGNNSKYVYELHLGNGGTVIDSTGIITYKDVEENLKLGTVAELYNPIYYKVVDSADIINNDDETRNYITVDHTDGLIYSDVVVTCTLEENQPDTAENSGIITFDEIGLKNKGDTGLNSGYLLSHLVFEPVEKTAGRVIQVVYTLRVSL
jgi:hypothetical protein